MSNVLFYHQIKTGCIVKKRIAVTNRIFSFSDQCKNQAQIDSKHADQQTTRFSRLEIYLLLMLFHILMFF